MKLKAEKVHIAGAHGAFFLSYQVDPKLQPNSIEFRHPETGELMLIVTNVGVPEASEEADEVEGADDGSHTR